MKRTTFATAPCPIARAADITGDWWNPLIIRECLYGCSRFEEFQHWLGISRNILSQRLSALADADIIERRQYQERPARFSYHLTDKGFALADVLLVMHQFGTDWCFPESGPGITLHRKDGKAVKIALVDAETGEPVSAADLVPKPGPSFPQDPAIRRQRFGDV